MKEIEITCKLGKELSTEEILTAAVKALGVSPKIKDQLRYRIMRRSIDARNDIIYRYRVEVYKPGEEMTEYVLEDYKNVSEAEPIIIIGGFLSGMLFSYMYLLKRSIILPILLHICNNTIAYGLHVISYGGKPLMEYIGSEHYYLSVYLVSLLLVLVFIAFMIKRFMKEKRALQKREQ